jgi:flavin reductase (DIM6/NTAB) family NADH-FMN oxidoreductase RutF
LTDPLQFRRCLGRFATGVTVITCAAPDGTPCGITANSFSSVSLDPPLVLWNIAKVSRSLDAYLAARNFGINVLTSDQEPVSVRFARSEPDLFRGVDHVITDRGVPRLRDTLAWFECRTYRTLDCGDHYIVIGEVLDFEAGDGEPLLFFGGRYNRLRDI